MHPFAEHVNPHLGRLLARLNLDKRFVRGQGCYLWDAEGRRYLDAIAAYGALPFGHNPPEVWAALQAVQAAAEPAFVQPSYLEAAGELARRLVQVAPPGLRYVTFANSGAEAVEAAIKLCRAATGRMGILTTENSFHGKTLGALSATGRSAYQADFGAPVPGFDRVPYGDVDALAAALATGRYAAFIVEPIQGEGGIVEPPPGYLAAARELTRRHGTLLVFDEIQTGLGRTGRLWACEEEGVAPDVLTVAKALSGGLVPIGAVLCTEEAYTEAFATKHSSTFAGGALACRAGLAALDLLTRDGGALVRHVAATGAYLKDGLLALQRRYPHILTAVRGRGFMLGLEFGCGRDAFPGSLLGVAAEQEFLTPAISSYLLNVEGVRVAPTLNGNQVIRIEPPLIAGREECDRLLAALDRTLAALAAGNTAAFVCHLLGVDPARVWAVGRAPAPEGAAVAGPASAAAGAPPVAAALEGGSGAPVEAVATPLGAPTAPAAPAICSAGSDVGRFAFLVHPVDIRNYPEFDESLRAFTPEELQDLAWRINDILQPFVIGRTWITSAVGCRAYGEFVVVPRTAEELLAMPSRQAVAEVMAAVQLARERGARIVGLGAYTSVVTRGGLHLKDAGVALTTGNSYTVVAGVEAILTAVQRLGVPLGQATAAVVGATGSIGRATAILLAEGVGRLVLVGNPARPDQSRRRLARVAGEALRHVVSQSRSGMFFAPGSLGDAVLAAPGRPDLDAPAEEWAAWAEALAQGGGPVAITRDLDEALGAADVVVTATSSTAELVTPEALKYGACVCDLSRPPNVSRAVKAARPDVLVIDGGVVAVPGRPSLGWNFGFEPGLAYACMAETMILALEQRYEDTSLGADLNLATILEMRALGKKHGFALAQLRSFDRPLDEAEWQRILEARVAGAVGR